MAKYGSSSSSSSEFHVVDVDLPEVIDLKLERIKTSSLLHHYHHHHHHHYHPIAADLRDTTSLTTAMAKVPSLRGE